jgi:hypothetical protein
VKTNSPITARSTTGTTVQMISRRVAPWTCGPSAVRARLPRRYLMMNAISTPSTPTRTIPVKIATKMKASLMRCAFGECADDGRKPPFPASATEAAASATTLATRVVMAVRRTPVGIV